jgi:DNA-binding CsgD family transcriptional regulator
MASTRFWQIAETFGTLAQRCESPADLRALLADVIRELGYDWFALVFGIGWGCPLKDWWWIHNYPDVWVDMFFSSGFYVRDPILCRGEFTSELFFWHESGELRHLCARDRRIMRLAGRCGLIHGVTYPFNRVREPSGSLSLVSRGPRIMTIAEHQCIIAIGSAAIKATRRLCGYPGAAMKRPELPEYLHPCIELVAMGKEAHEIAQILDLSLYTVRTYVQRARDALNVTDRAQLAFEARRLGLIGFADVKPPGPRD